MLILGSSFVERVEEIDHFVLFLFWIIVKLRMVKEQEEAVYAENKEQRYFLGVVGNPEEETAHRKEESNGKELGENDAGYQSQVQDEPNIA